MSWSDEFGSNFIKLPIGTKVQFTVKDIKKITNKPQFDLKNKDGVSSGYHFEFHTDKGILTVGSWSLLFALKNAGVDKDDEVEIDHRGKGEYIVTKVNAF